MNLHQKSLDPRNLDFDNLLSHQQGNILKGHGRDLTTNIFLQFKTPDVAAARKWVREFAESITSCKTQLRETELFKRHNVSGKLFRAFLLSAKGYQFFGHPLTGFTDPSFKAGMKSQQINLKDPPVAAWEPGFQQDIHAMILLAHTDSDEMAVEAKKILEAVSKFANVLTVEYGHAIRNANHDGLEHFGYVDGISQPLFFKDEVDANLNANIQPLKFDPSAFLDLVLLSDPLVPGGLNAPDSCGSYFVFRKLEQNVRGFNEAEDALADFLGLQGEDDERAGAMLVGRFEDGTPVTLLKEAGMIASATANNFDYSQDSAGARCPFHGHIRKTNPRSDPSQKGRIMARRGIPFGCRNVNTETDPSPVQMPSGGVGLMFMSFQKSLVDQFEFIQKSWANDPNFPPSIPASNKGIDPIIGQDGVQNISTGKFAKEWDKPATLTQASFGHFVTMKGGEYFFAPSIPFLEKVI